jgi:signal transduction histidine kinase
MISQVLNMLERGITVMRMNSRLLMVGVLVFVFPLLFVWITQNFFTTAYDNINTAEKQRVGLLHDTLAYFIENAKDIEVLLPGLLQAVAAEHTDITKMRVSSVTPDETIIRFAIDPTLVGTVEESDDLYRTLPLATADDSLIFETSLNGVRTWQVFRYIDRPDGGLYLFTEHQFARIDSVMMARQQQSYIGLAAIFVFLIALAYWLNSQSDWERNHRKLAKQLHERDLFSNMIAHEFRSPLTAIKGYASFLEESKNLEKDELRFAHNIRHSAERLVLLVNDFLEVARLQSGKLTIEKQAVDIRSVLVRVRDDLQVMAEKKGLRLVYEEPVQAQPMQTDPARMTQVITNLVSNAIKYTDSGAVELECIQDGPRTVIKIKDTGMGISAEDQARLFAPFTRVGGVDQTSTTGTGLGMWITRELVTLLGGSIGVESIKDVGTHVVVTFRS